MGGIEEVRGERTEELVVMEIEVAEVEEAAEVGGKRSEELRSREAKTDDMIFVGRTRDAIPATRVWIRCVPGAEGACGVVKDGRFELKQSLTVGAGEGSSTIKDKEGGPGAP